MELAAAIGDGDPGRARPLLEREERILTKFFACATVRHASLGDG
ncbi:hypothetical protein [Amycolatopsis sp.]|jgi:hypothetical protein|nr:hypothetical protein [Amycolatopsis sp.]